ncbi:MAG TPA: SRPBCC domain-containing protein [Methylomirabilota bacterium]|nr:SRPBCC domain-containing protein [Methylomirabilota bacterium]
MPERLDVVATHKEFIRAPREKVYDAFATADGLNAWFTEGARIDARPGGAMVFRFVDWGADKINAEFAGRVVEARRPERFVFQWGIEKPEATTTVELTFEERDGGTLVQVREHGFVDIKNALGNSVGWGQALTLTKFWVERAITVHPQRTHS